jgi:uncharacterized protein (DUF58 family)
VAAFAKLGRIVAEQREKSRRRPRRRARLTREGKVFVFVTVGVGIAAVNTGNNLLYLMLGLMLSLLLLSMVLSEIALKRVFVTRRLPLRAWARTPTLIELVLRNEKRFLPSYSLEVEDQAEDEPTERRCYFLKVSAEGEQVAAYQRVPAKRGRLALVGYRIGTRYPFGLVEKAYVHVGEGELLVYPELVDVDPAIIRGLFTGTDRPDPFIGRGTEIAGLREYVAGDEARSIHWRRTAALGNLVVKERQRDASSRVTFVLDNARPDGADAAWDEGFEHAISRVASLTAEAMARGATVDVVTRGARSPLLAPGSAPDPVWRFLAELEVAEEDAKPPGAGRGGILIDVVPREPRQPEGGGAS